MKSRRGSWRGENAREKRKNDHSLRLFLSALSERGLRGKNRAKKTIQAMHVDCQRGTVGAGVSKEMHSRGKHVRTTTPQKPKKRGRRNPPTFRNNGEKSWESLSTTRDV